MSLQSLSVLWMAQTTRSVEEDTMDNGRNESLEESTRFQCVERMRMKTLDSQSRTHGILVSCGEGRGGGGGGGVTGPIACFRKLEKVTIRWIALFIFRTTGAR